MRPDDNEEKRDRLYGLLGDPPSRDYPVTVKSSRQTSDDRYDREDLLLDLNGREPVPAILLKPSGSGGKLPCVLYHHSHGNFYHLGKNELVNGVPYQQQPPYGEALTARGFAVCCIDSWCFGERHVQDELTTIKEMQWKGEVLWGMRVFDSLKTMDYLAGRPDLDSSRIGTLGMSMGSTMAWWLAALDARVKVCVDICCLTDFAALLETRALDRHGLYYFVPSLLKHFTTAEINALIAPRPHLSLAGNLDPLTPPAGLDRIDRELRHVYAKAGGEDCWQLKRYEVAHQETPEMRSSAIRFLQKWL